MLARVLLSKPLPSQHVAPANQLGSATSSGNQVKHPGCSDGSHVFIQKGSLDAAQLEILRYRFAPNLLQVSSPSQPQERSRTKTHLIHLPTREADLHPLSHQPHCAQDADQAEEKAAVTASTAFAVPSGPFNEVLLNRPKESLELPKTRRQHSALGPVAASLAPVGANLMQTCSCRPATLVLKNLKKQTSCHTNQ